MMQSFKKRSSKGLERGFFFARSNNKGVIDVGNIILGLLILGAVYASYIFAPIVWKKQELKTLLKELSYQLKTVPEDRAIEQLVDLAKRDLSMVLDPKNIRISVSEDHILLKVLWKPKITIITGQTYVFPVEVVQNTTIFH